ncbi:class Ib ribonucleoside-diphosphate reductase assembly flavoprotein NrdI [Rarobacter faecitabidus]|uniref:Protein NrdI n=1 Tax=Rarobacter faecitabidus TaxID=13243 RepID=A0A542ZX36_RARFA|nr:class Ib ribonucleoside-diphosphate reductase assembly flavoprotein NrdI [Rarobacter faecitabidus]TQL64914.1 protein involved in ribonucleotide reduction [Rarobacter faecitabidus]
MASLVYFSSVSENTRKFVDKVGLAALRIPLRRSDPDLQVGEPYVLVTPTYGGGDHGGAVPRQVIKFLNVPGNRALIRGVIAAGNTNFGSGYCLAGDIVSAKCQVPYLYAFELMGTPQDVTRVQEGLVRFWQRQPRSM